MKLEAALVKAMQKAVTRLPGSVIQALEKAAGEAEGPAQTQLESILTNVEVASANNIPLCQDTGMQTFFVEAGADFPYLDQIKPAISSALGQATEEIPLRPNTVDPFSEINPGDNRGENSPFIHWDIVPGGKCRIRLLPKGGGAENMCSLKMLPPAAGLDGVKDFVLERVVEAGGKPCPPVILGIGIGGGADFALKLGKEALLRPLGNRHSNPEVAELEEELLEQVNEIGGGPMGVGGRPTALGVHVEYAVRHPASLPVGLVVQCWAHRRASVIIDRNGECRVE